MIRAVLDTNTFVSGTPTETVAVSLDPDDDRLIEAALAANADVIVTGDQDLLTLGLSARSRS